MLSEQAKEARRRYKAEWAQRNKDKVKQQQERYWEKLAAQQAQQAQDTGEAHEQQA